MQVPALDVSFKWIAPVLRVVWSFTFNRVDTAVKKNGAQTTQQAYRLHQLSVCLLFIACRWGGPP